ncbi:MAG: M12 family metallo-peptidase [Acidobacteriota bacterium]|nr:M12 family metallo-peptidase [Acidobacteriota bacterium]
MEPELANRFPEIKTYRGYSLDDPTLTTRFDWTPTGFHAIILGAKETVLVEPYAKGNTDYYVAYFQADVPVASYACEVTTEEQDAAIAQAHTHSRKISPAVITGANLRTYRLAVAATAEYTQTYGGGTVNGGLAAITTTMNLVNAIYEREVAVRMVLVANETSIIFTDTATDGYTHDTVSSLITQNQTKLDSVIGTANYDIGHVFDGRSLGGGAFSFQGRASLSSVCQAGLKARGVSITRSIPPSDLFAYYIVAHEMGHQFSATHTFNATTGDCGLQRSAATAYEPGTGSTIMAYRFNCGPEDLSSSDTYFHTASIEQIVNYTTSGNGSCATLTATGNNPPSVNAGPNYLIPHNTPFTLTATASDPDGDSLLLAWEQFDLGNPSPPNTDDGSRPIFRSIIHPDPARTFPAMRDLVYGPTGFFESLPTTNRTMNFRVTARDNRSGGGGVNSAATQVQVTTSSGPFTVTQPVAGTQWTTGSQQTVTWNVANTTSAPVSCATVSILLSTDFGMAYPIILALDTPNDGSETITLPGGVNSPAHVMVRARGNIFFNISPAFYIFGPNNTTPTISGFSPGSGSAQSSVTITGTNFVNPSVTFNGTPATFVVHSTTQIVAVVPNGATTGPIRVTTPSGTAVSPTNFVVGEASVQFSLAGYSISESGGAFNATVMRSGSTAAVTTVNYRTSDTAGLDNCNVLNGNASPRCDYTTTVGTLRFEAGQTAKNISIPLVDDSYAEATESFMIGLSEVTGGSLGATVTAILTINDNEVTNGANPVEGTPFFVRQQYLDFLNREPDPAGNAAWQSVINNCPAGDTTCDRIHVSSAFFRSPEFQDRGYFVYRFYPVAFGRKPEYVEFVPDLAKVSGFLSDAELEAAKVGFIAEFMSRPGFFAKFNGLTDTQYVDTLLSTAQVTSPHRDFWIAALGNGTRTRATVLRDISESPEVYNKYYNQAFVVIQYFGYLRRDPDALYLNWITHLESTSDYRSMINGFMNSLEYRFRFGP